MEEINIDNIPPVPSNQDKKFINFSIEIWINDLEQGYVELLLLDFFGRNKSPILPIYVRFKVIDTRINKNWVKREANKFQVAEINNDEAIYYNSLADINIHKHPSHVVIHIDALDNDTENWERVKNITKEIISKMRELNYSIEKVRPVELQPQVPASKLNELASKSSDVKLPDQPQARSGLAKWFKYFYERNKTRNKITLKELAYLSKYSYSYIRLKHPSYKREHDKGKPNKNT